MKDEDAPVSPDEFVVRLIWMDYYKPETASPVRNRAFLPRQNEEGGISVFRAACLSDPTDALRVMAVERRGKYALALIPVAELTALGLSVQPEKIDTVPGHAVIPELSAELLTTDPTTCNRIQEKLAALAAKNLIPPAEPKA